MRSVERILNYNSRLVTFALYDIIEKQSSDCCRGSKPGEFTAKLFVYGNESNFFCGN